VTSEFLGSTPEAYRRAFGTEEQSEHARIVARRAGRLAHAELCKATGRGLVCVVADDRAGLLTLITDALLVHGLSVVSADAFCRARPDGITEALDVLEIGGSRPTDGVAFDVSLLESFVHTLGELIAEDIRASSRPSAPVGSREARTRVYFELEPLRQGQYVLRVETPDSEGVLHAICSALHAQGARIVSCRIGTDAGMARDRFELVGDAGRAFSETELCDIQFAVFEALPRRVSVF
jgi:UTP:GlnB (protein PII) uridylyltransferase